MRRHSFDEEKGLAMAICKRMNGNNGRYFEAFKKYCHKEDQTDPVVNSAFENLKKHIDTFSEPEVLHMEKETTTVKD